MHNSALTSEQEVSITKTTKANMVQTAISSSMLRSSGIPFIKMNDKIAKTHTFANVHGRIHCTECGIKVIFLENNYYSKEVPLSCKEKQVQDILE